MARQKSVGAHKTDRALLLEDDIKRTLIPQLWEPLRDASIFVTGGTGFFGRWLLESFTRANEVFELGASILILTRNIDTFRKKAPHLADHPAIRFQLGDVRDFDFPAGRFSHIIHAAATNAHATFNNEDALTKFDTVSLGTRRTLEFAASCGATRILFTGSASVYGKTPAGMTHIAEDYRGAPTTADFSASALGEGKRVAEFYCAYFAAKYGFDLRIARCFSFVGPHLPLDIHYAIGNFIRDALYNDTITVNGDGSPMRSYMYLSDLIVWLLTLLEKGKPGGVYNVGSDQAISIRDLAYLVRDTLSPGMPVKIRGQLDTGVGGDWYVPDIQRAREELGLDIWTPLPDAIRLTAVAAAS